MKQIINIKGTLPFSHNDFYGYILPGAILVFFATIICIWFTALSFRDLREFLYAIEELKIIVGVVGLFGFLTLVYFVGHVNATISHILYDRTAIKKIIGYPILTLLEFPDKLRHFSKASNFYLLSLINIIILLPLLKLMFPLMPGFQFLYTTCIVFLLSIIPMRAIIGFLESYFFEKPQNGYSTIENIRSSNKYVRYIVSFIHSVYCMGFNFFQFWCFPVISYIFSFSEPLPKDIVTQFKKNIIQYGYKPEDIETGNYWLPIIYVHRYEPAIESHLNHWMNLYSFLRNLSLVAFILCLEVSLFITLYYLNIGSVYHITGKYDIYIASFLSLFLFATGWILAIRYWIIYRNYYTKYLIRSFASADIAKRGSNQSSSFVGMICDRYGI